MMASAELWPYVALILLGFLPNEVWRFLGLWLARGLDEDSQIVLIARAVATALITGVVAKLIVFATGALETIPISVRIAAAVGGFVAFLAVRRSVFVGVAVAEVLLLAGGFFYVR
jgi:hypothetical protein